jgi:hypothetical protein
MHPPAHLLAEESTHSFNKDQEQRRAKTQEKHKEHNIAGFRVPGNEEFSVPRQEVEQWLGNSKTTENEEMQ